MSQLLQCPVCWIEQFNTLGWPFGDAEEARRFVSMFPLTFKATDVTCRCGATFPAVVHTKFDGEAESMTGPTITRIGPYTYLVIGADKYLLTAEDCERLLRDLRA